MSPSVKLTDAAVRAIRPTGTQIEYLDLGEPGLALRVSAKGVKSWTMRYRNSAGQQRRVTLGKFPGMSVAKARIEAKQKSIDIADGRDPAAEKRDQRARKAAGEVSSVTDLVNAYFADSTKGRHRRNGKPKRASTIAQEKEFFERLIKPKFGKLEIAELTRPTVQSFLDQIGDKSPGTARQCRNIIRQAYNYAIRRDIASANPAQFAQVSASASRDRVVTDSDLRAIWQTCNSPAGIGDLQLSSTMGWALQLVMTTLQRGGEVCGLHTREIDRESRIWTLPAERSKNHRTHLIPLSDLATEIIDKALASSGTSDGYVFPSPRSGEQGKQQPITRHALTRACKRLTTALDIDDATPHDLRRTGATKMTSERIGVRRFIVSRVLNHVSATEGAAVTAVYDRNEYLSDKRAALDAWGNLLNEIVSGESRGSNVVSIGQAQT